MAARLEAKARLQEQAREAQAEAQRLNKQTQEIHAAHTNTLRKHTDAYAPMEAAGDRSACLLACLPVNLPLSLCLFVADLSVAASLGSRRRPGPPGRCCLAPSREQKNLRWTQRQRRWRSLRRTPSSSASRQRCNAMVSSIRSVSLPPSLYDSVSFCPPPSLFLSPSPSLSLTLTHSLGAGGDRCCRSGDTGRGSCH